MFARRLSAGLAAVVTASGLAVAGSVPAHAAPAHDTELHAALTGSHDYPRARGTASYVSGDHGRELDIHLHGMAGLAGRRLVIYLHGARAGTMTVTGSGYAHLDRHGAGPCRPGQPVRVRTSSGTLVAAGTFRHHHQEMMAAAARGGPGG